MSFRPHVFEPTFQKHARRACGGVQIVVRDRRALRPVHLGVAILCTVRRLWPDELRWRTEVYEFEVDRLAIDLLLGEHGIRERIDAGASADDIAAEWRPAEAAFAERRRAWLVYPP